MRISTLAVVFLGTTLIGIALNPAHLGAEETKQQKQNLKGLQFNVPSDWPIEQRNGTLGPIPIEEYLTLKFDKIDARINETKIDLAQINEKFKALDARLTTVEESLAVINAKLSDVGDRLKR